MTISTGQSHWLAVGERARNINSLTLRGLRDVTPLFSEREGVVALRAKGSRLRAQG